jgi:penicillin-binding protein 1A
MSPCDSIIDAPFTADVITQKSPRNSDNQYRGMVTLKALANSINTVSAKLMDKVGPEAVVSLHIN